MIFEQEMLKAVATIKPLFLLIIALVVYSMFTFKMYTHLSKKDLFDFNFESRSKIKNEKLKKFVALLIYSLEHAFILPVIIFFWFAMMTIVIVFITQNSDAHTVAIISMAMVGAIRVCAYYAERLSEDLAKLLPFSLLAIALSQYQMLSIQSVEIVFAEISNTFFTILYYVALIILLEVVLRISHHIYRKINPEKED